MLTGARVLDGVRRVLARLWSNVLAADSPLEEPPLRSELFSADQMEQHGRYLASSHALALEHAPDQLLPRLAANEEILRQVFQQLSEAVNAGRHVTPASEWLLDNFYLIEEQIRTAKRHLPKNYSRELPRLAHGASAGFPRVYDIALETIAHGDGRVDLDGLSRFLAAYQDVTTLNLGELWAIPIMLRLALIENLRRVALRIAAGRNDRDLADEWSRQMITTIDQDPKSLILVIADMARSNPPMSAPFVSEFVRDLQGQSPALTLALNWIEQRLAEDGTTIEQLVQAGNQSQAADQVTLGNSIGSLRFLSSVDWRNFVESMSAVDGLLRAGSRRRIYRDGFRHPQPISRRHRAHRPAQRADGSAGGGNGPAAGKERSRAADRGGDANVVRQAHVGHYLIDRGLDELERAAGFRRPVSHRRPPGGSPRATAGLSRGDSRDHGGALRVPGVDRAAAGDAAGWRLWLLFVLAVIGTSQLALTLVNWLATLLVTPRALPRMDFSKGIPSASRALVVVPTMLSSAGNIDDLAEALEVRFLANRDENLRFGLLTDFGDAASESMPGDAALLEHAQRGSTN